MTSEKSDFANKKEARHISRAYLHVVKLLHRKFEAEKDNGGLERHLTKTCITRCKSVNIKFINMLSVMRKKFHDRI